MISSAPEMYAARLVTRITAISTKKMTVRTCFAFPRKRKRFRQEMICPPLPSFNAISAIIKCST